MNVQIMRKALDIAHMLTRNQVQKALEQFNKFNFQHTYTEVSSISTSNDHQNNLTSITKYEKLLETNFNKQDNKKQYLIRIMLAYLLIFQHCYDPKTNQIRQAQKYLRDVLQIFPGELSAIYMIISIYQLQKKIEKICQFLIEQIQINSSDQVLQESLLFAATSPDLVADIIEQKASRQLIFFAKLFYMAFQIQPPKQLQNKTSEYDTKKDPGFARLGPSWLEKQRKILSIQQVTSITIITLLTNILGRLKNIAKKNKNFDGITLAIYNSGFHKNSSNSYLNLLKELQILVEQPCFKECKNKGLQESLHNQIKQFLEINEELKLLSKQSKDVIQLKLITINLSLKIARPIIIEPIQQPQKYEEFFLEKNIERLGQQNNIHLLITLLAFFLEYYGQNEVNLQVCRRLASLHIFKESELNYLDRFSYYLTQYLFNHQIAEKNTKFLWSIVDMIIHIQTLPHKLKVRMWILSLTLEKIFRIDNNQTTLILEFQRTGRNVLEEILPMQSQIDKENIRDLIQIIQQIYLDATSTAKQIMILALYAQVYKRPNTFGPDIKQKFPYPFIIKEILCLKRLIFNEEKCDFNSQPLKNIESQSALNAKNQQTILKDKIQKIALNQFNMISFKKEKVCELAYQMYLLQMNSRQIEELRQCIIRKCYSQGYEQNQNKLTKLDLSKIIEICIISIKNLIFRGCCRITLLIKNVSSQKIEIFVSHLLQNKTPTIKKVFLRLKEILHGGN